MASIQDAHKKLTAKVMGRPGVAGTAIGKAGGKPCLKVYLSDPRVRGAMPSTVDGHEVVVEESGAFRRL